MKLKKQERISRLYCRHYSLGTLVPVLAKSYTDQYQTLMSGQWFESWALPRETFSELQHVGHELSHNV